MSKKKKEMVCYDDGKPMILSSLVELSEDQIKIIMDIIHWIDLDFLASMVEVQKQSLKKYKKDNWKLGTKYSRRLNSAFRHLLKFAKGIDLDDELGTSHEAMVAINMMMVHYWKQHGKGQDDRPKK